MSDTMRGEQPKAVGDDLAAEIERKKQVAIEEKEDDDEDCLVFRGTRQEKKVKILLEDGAPPHRFWLIEMFSDGVEKWMKFQTTRLSGGGKRGRPDISDANFKDYTATLISMCLYDDTKQNRIPLDVIRNWPASTLNGLFDYCETMNGLNEQGREQAKKA